MIAWLARKGRAAADVLVAGAAVFRARRQVARLPIGELVTTSAEMPPEPGASSLPIQEQRCGARWGMAIDRALRWLPGDAACLVRSRALREVVVTRGLPRAQVRIGVRRGASGFEAHAWVEQDGAPIAEPVILRGAFAPLAGVTLR